MRKFDPWPIFFKREWNRNWPFLVGFAITGTLITKFSLGLTEEDAKNSPFVQRHKSRLCASIVEKTALVLFSRTIITKERCSRYSFLNFLLCFG
ncbi:hypothetical protein DVH24_032815 [Malus domestica]|uniref:Uncharacterized protein n=1 Tax=Malus domestica TaxID=3750 RepID=A0A498ISV4_MALDO|nr:hypothetical protein DVH24_032815 [Malus domestica]